MQFMDWNCDSVSLDL